MITQFEYDEIQRDIKADKFETESPSVIQAIIETKEVISETGMSPRQLLEQRNELLDLLIWFVDSKRANFLVHGSDPKFHIARETISRIVNSSIAAARTHCEERSSSGEAKTSKEGV